MENETRELYEVSHRCLVFTEDASTSAMYDKSLLRLYYYYVVPRSNMRHYFESLDNPKALDLNQMLVSK